MLPMCSENYKWKLSAPKQQQGKLGEFTGNNLCSSLALNPERNLLEKGGSPLREAFCDRIPTGLSEGELLIWPFEALLNIEIDSCSFKINSSKTQLWVGKRAFISFNNMTMLIKLISIHLQILLSKKSHLAHLILSKRC